MKITKFGHCCLLIENKGVRILTDPGTYTTDQNSISKINIVLITHEHIDHLHIESVLEILKNNPSVQIICNSSVAKLLKGKGINCEILEGQDSKEFFGMLFEAYDAKHAEIFEEWGQVQNTGYFLDKKLFYPGDALHDPKRKIDTLAFPTAGGWANIKESINYVLALKPKKSFPVHDGAFGSTPFFYNVYKSIMPSRGIELILPGKGQEFEI